MSLLRRFLIVAACLLETMAPVYAQQFKGVRSTGSADYRLNRLGAQAYMQGGAFAVETGNVTAMLFNPAGLAGLSGRLTATVEAGWISETSGQQFSGDELLNGLQPVQFAGIGLQPWRHLAIGMYYAQPARYDADEVVESIRWESRHHRHHVESRVMQREQASLGLVLASVLGKQFYFGGGVEWRSSGFRARAFRLQTQNDATAVRFSAGAILNVWDWRIGVSGQTRYQALDLEGYRSHGRGSFDYFTPFAETPTSSASFVEAEPAAVRLGIATPYVLGRLRFSADAEYKNFNTVALVAPWQIYGGGTFKLASNAYLSFGGFTSAQDYSTYFDDAYLTAGAMIELAQFRLSASFIDSEFLAKNFAGQQFANFAISYVIP